jgi:hypothetical protein
MKNFFYNSVSLYSVFFFPSNTVPYYSCSKWDSQFRRFHVELTGCCSGEYYQRCSLPFLQIKGRAKSLGEIAQFAVSSSNVSDHSNSIYGFLCWILGTENWFYELNI